MSSTVGRAVAVIVRIADKPATLGELAGEFGVHKSTVLRLLQTLERARFVRRDPGGRYAIGPRLINVAHQALESMDVREVARPHLIRLNQMYGHTVHLASFLDGEITYVDKYEGRASIRMYSRIGKTAPLHASGVGRAVLAHLEPALRDGVISRLTFVRYTARTVTSEHQLRERLAEVRSRGYAVDQGEFEDHINCIAAPLRSGDGTVRSAISISVPTMVIGFEELRQLVPDLTAAARAISADLGWPGDPARDPGSPDVVGATSGDPGS